MDPTIQYSTNYKKISHAGKCEDCFYKPETKLEMLQFSLLLRDYKQSFQYFFISNEKWYKKRYFRQSIMIYIRDSYKFQEEEEEEEEEFTDTSMKRKLIILSVTEEESHGVRKMDERSWHHERRIRG